MGPTMPTSSGFYDHVFAAINETHYLMVHLQEAWVFDAIMDTWKLAASPSRSYYLHAMAGHVNLPDGWNAVVVGGKYAKSAEMFVNDAWSQVADLPHVSNNLWHACSVQLHDTFLLAGGWIGGVGFQNSILKFDTSTLSWDTLPQKLSMAVNGHSCALVPEDYLVCHG